MPFDHIQKFRNNFLARSQEEKERIFALSCFDAEHWQQTVHWDLREEEIDRKIKNACVELFGTKWNAFERKNTWTTFKTRYWYQGPMVNYLLAWYIEDELRYTCEPEGPNDKSKFDILVKENSSNMCSIGIKRLAKAGRVGSYIQEHRRKIEDNSESCQCDYILNIFPVSNNEHPGRVENLVEGYGYMSVDTHEFFGKDSVFVANIAAPVFNSENHIGPLETIESHLTGYLGL